MAVSFSKHVCVVPDNSLHVQVTLPVTAIPGQVFYDGSTSGFKVYNGAAWVDVNPAAFSIGLNYEAEAAISWAIDNMKKQQEVKDMSHKYELVADAVMQLEIAMKLCQNINDDTSASK